MAPFGTIDRLLPRLIEVREAIVIEIGAQRCQVMVNRLAFSAKIVLAILHEIAQGRTLSPLMTWIVAEQAHILFDTHALGAIVDLIEHVGHVDQQRCPTHLSHKERTSSSSIC